MQVKELFFLLSEEIMLTVWLRYRYIAGMNLCDVRCDDNRKLASGLIKHRAMKVHNAVEL
jgi:hypothetical protein